MHLRGPHELDPSVLDFTHPTGEIVGSPQVPFLMCTLEIPQKIAVQVLCS